MTRKSQDQVIVNLYEAVDDDGGVRGNFNGRAKRWSAYQSVAAYPVLRSVTLAALAGVAWAILRCHSRRVMR